MTKPTPRIKLIAYNAFLGGDDGGDESRREAQVQYLATQDADLLWITEASGWHRDHGRRIRDLAIATGTMHLPPVTSHIGDGHNQSVLFFRPSRLREVTYRELARGAFHHGATRAEFEINGTRLLILGTHLAYADGDSRLREAHHFADYARPFGTYPSNAILVGDLNMPDDTDEDPIDWDQVPQNLWHRYREFDDGTFGKLDRRARDMLLASGWRDPQHDVDQERAATTGYWWKNELVPMRIDQALVTGDQLEVVDYRTHDTPELRKLSDHLPLELTIRLRAGDALPAFA